MAHRQGVFRVGPDTINVMRKNQVALSALQGGLIVNGRQG